MKIPGTGEMSPRTRRALGALILGLGGADAMNIRPVSLAFLIAVGVAAPLFGASELIARRRRVEEAEDRNGA